ncbi:MAG: septum formation protein Maf [Verrucomicrobia bacterium]|nr:septum formation protein Maf [Cytophagales bacterium]
MNIKRPIILASGSPRRRQLLTELGFDFVVKTKNTDESFPETMPVQEVPLFLAEKKANAFASEISDEILIAADTVVIIDNKILNKPAHKAEAFAMLHLLSGRKHEVITGVCLLSATKKVLFSDLAEVFFRDLSDSEVEFYVEKYQPFDKAGAYGAQEWMGMVGIEKIIGSYFNVMGLPVHKLYQELMRF